LYFIPTYSSWLNKIELSLGKIERDVFAAVPDLRRNAHAMYSSLQPVALDRQVDIMLARSATSVHNQLGQASWPQL
jgi:hypothetical protein